MAIFILSLFKNYIFWMIFTAVFCFIINIGINFILSYLWSFLTNRFLPSWLFYVKYFQIIILFFYNYFLIRYIVRSWIFEWQHPFQIFSIYKERQTYLKYLKSIVNDFVKAIDALLLDFNSLPKIEVEYFDSFFYLFEEEFNIYHKLYSIVNLNNNGNNLVTYKMSNCQIRYYNLLKEINNLLYKDNLKNNLLLKSKKKAQSNEENNIKNDNNIINTDNSDAIHIIQNSDSKENISQLKKLLVEYQQIIEAYDIKNYTYMSPFYLFNLIFNDTFGSLSLYSLQFKKNYEDYQLENNFTPKGKIHYTLIIKKNDEKAINISNDNSNEDNNLIKENTKNNSDNGVLMIFCLPNGSLYELIPKDKINFYMNNGFSFLCWNYNGYGFSKGSPNFTNVKANILELYDIIVQNPKYNFKKICVMGHSIGGVPAFYLAKNRHVDLLISDRNFCDLNRLVNNIYCGQILSFLLKYLFIGNTDNIDNFFSFELDNAYKIILYSPLDNMILNDASVKSGISRYILKNYIIYNNKESMNIIKNKENILDIVFEKNEKERFLNDFLELVHLYYDNKEDYYYYNENNKNDKKENLQNDINTDNYNKDFIDRNENLKSLDNALFSFFEKFYGYSCDDLDIIIKAKLSLRRQKIFIDNFFNNLLIWGIQMRNENDDQFEFNSYYGVKALIEAYHILNEFVSNFNQNKLLERELLLINISQNLKKIINFIDNLDIITGKSKNNNINSNNIKEENESKKEQLISNNEEEITTNITDINNDINKNIKKDNDYPNNNIFYDKLNNIKEKIKLLKTYAGHNGWLNEEEIQEFYIFLLSSGIIS